MLKQSKKSIPELGPDYSALSCQTDAAGIILSASAGLLSFTGKHAAELIGHSFKKIIDAADKPRLQAILNTGIANGVVVQLAIKGKTAIHHIGFTASFNKRNRKANEVIEWNAVAETKNGTGITPVNSLIEKLFRFSTELLCLLDEEGYITKANQPLADVLSFGIDELVGKQLKQFVHPDERATFIYNEEKTAHRFYCKNGQVTTLSWSATPVDDGNLVLAMGCEVSTDSVVAAFVDLGHKKATEIELQRSQQQLREYSERITNILASITDGFIAVDKNRNIFLWNHAVEHITGLKAQQVVGSGIETIFPGLAGTAEYHQYIDALAKGASSNFEHYMQPFGRWVETSVYPYSQGAFIYFRDITDRKKQERLLELEKEVLEINAQPAASLKATIDYFIDGLEKIFSNMLCSVIMLSDDRRTVIPFAGPGLPEGFSDALSRLKIGPTAASCGTAIYRKEKVITVDVETDPLWDEYRYLARKFNFRSCWSFPILNAAGDVLATVAVYHRHAAAPTENELSLFERVSSLLRVIIENKHAELKIRLSYERYLLVTKATNDAIWDWDVNTNTLYWGEGIYTLFGFKPGYVDSAAGFWESCIHPEDRHRVVSGLNGFIKDGTSKIWEDEYRFVKPNGEYALVFDRGFLIFDHSGKIARMVGSMQDITDKKQMEKRLLKQEVDKQKTIAQAVVNAQEKERAEIGKELHDNVNQILSTAKLYLELAQTEDDSRLDLINRSTKNISDAINEIRTISRSLVPPSIGDLGLIDSLQDLVENIRATRKLHVEFYYSGTIDDVLDEKRKLMLFRIIQEQVNNVLKHAQAQNLVIELIADSEGHAVDLTISDDGRGFELDKVRLKKGVGLSNITSRAQLFNGTVHLVTAIGEGCKLKINVPISNI